MPTTHSQPPVEERLPLLTPADLNEPQKELFDDMRAGLSDRTAAYIWETADQVQLGPSNALLTMPDIGKKVFDLQIALSGLKSVPIASQQIAILTTGVSRQAAYEVYAHGRMAVQAGVDSAKIATIVAGQRPADLTIEEACAYDLASAIARGGPVPKAIYAQAIHTFGQDGVIELAFLIGCFELVACVLNTFNVPVPQDDSDPVSLS